MIIACRAFSLGLLLSLLMAFTGLELAHVRRSSIELEQSLTEELNRVLDSATELHQAFFIRDEDQIESSLKQTIRSIKMAQSASLVLKEHDRQHVLRILDAAKSQLELTRVAIGDDRTNKLKSAFEQLVQLAKVYKTNRYRIYFCGEDRGTWLQSKGRAKNPFHPTKHKHCGLAVR